jgi:hypothetical protein
VSRLTVAYRTEGMTAQGGDDFVDASGTLVFDVGVRSQMFAVAVRDDSLAEETEHLLLHLATSTGMATWTRLAILDDDPVEVSDDAGPAGEGASPGRSAGGTRSVRPAAVVPAGNLQAPPSQVVRRRVSAASPRRVVPLRQSQVTPFELRTTSPHATGPMGPAGASGLPGRVDPLLALAAGLLLARVGAELWFRARALAR